MSEIIVALDQMSMAKALELANQAQGLVWGFKVNDLLLNYGAEIVYKLKAYGHVMADPKLHDIQNTISNGIRVLKTAGADIITVHASANYQPKSDEKEFLAGITVLTSFDDNDAFTIYDKTVSDSIRKFSQLLTNREYGYAVCSAQDLSIFKNLNIKTICPGIRPAWHQAADDQKRTMTPKEAQNAGADFLVIGRPLIMAENFLEAIKQTNDELKA